MAVTTDAYTNTDLAAVIPELWTTRVNKEFFAKAVFSNFVRDLSELGGDIIHVPGVYTNAFTPGTQSTQGAEITTESVAMDDNTLTVNTHRYVAILIGDKDAQQILRSVNISNVWAEKMADSLIKVLEGAIAALWSSVTTNTVGDTATILNDSEIRQAINKLDSANVPLEECAFFVHPYVYWNQLHSIAKYYDQGSLGPANSAGPVVTGNFPGNVAMARALRGQLYGIPIFTSTNVVSGLSTYRNLLLHKDAFAFAVQTVGGGKVRVQAEYQLRNLATLTIADMIYGVAVIREPVAVLVNASNAFLGS